MQSLRDRLEKAINETKGWAGLPMKSKCLKYDIPSSACFPLSSVGKEQWGPIAYQCGKGYETSQAVSMAGDKQITTVTVSFMEFNKTKIVSFGNEQRAETYRTSCTDSLRKDFYSTLTEIFFLRPCPR